jgi:hypothetical protein
MPATTPTIAELRSVLGIGSLYNDSVVDEVCQSAQDIVFSYLWNNDSFNVAHSADDYKRTLYFDDMVKDKFYVGQAIVVTGNDDLFNGTFSIEAVGENSITYTSDEGGRLRPYHLVLPYGKVAAQDDVDYATISAIREASLMVAVDIWQSRQASNSTTLTADFQPSPWRMSASLIAKVRGLLAPYLSPNSLVG